MNSKPTFYRAIVNGIQLQYTAQGQGPTVLLLHGFPETHRSWDLQVPALVGAGFRVIAPDLRGYGGSERPPSGYDLDTLSEDIIGLIHHLGVGPVTVVGHDWGGGIGWHLASRHPQALRRLILLNCPHPVRLWQELLHNPKQRSRSLYMLLFQLPWLPELWLTQHRGANIGRLFRTSSVGPGRSPQALIEAARQAMLEPGAAQAALAYYRKAFRSLLWPAARRRFLDSYGVIELPVSMLWGEQDSALGMELVRGTEKFVRHLTLHRVAEAGHFVHQERPELVNALLLEELSRPSPAGFWAHLPHSLLANVQPTGLA